MFDVRKVVRNKKNNVGKVIVKFDDKWSIMPLSKDITINKIIGKLKNLPDQVPAVKF